MPVVVLLALPHVLRLGFRAKRTSEPIGLVAAMTAVGHQERLPPPRLSGRCGFGEGTFAGTRGNGEDAPIPAVREAAIEPPGSTLLGHSNFAMGMAVPAPFRTLPRLDRRWGPGRISGYFNERETEISP
jgi:hypothetical protein